MEALFQLTLSSVMSFFLFSPLLLQLPCETTQLWLRHVPPDCPLTSRGEVSNSTTLTSQVQRGAQQGRIWKGQMYNIFPALFMTCLAVPFSVLHPPKRDPGQNQRAWVVMILRLTSPPSQPIGRQWVDGWSGSQGHHCAEHQRPLMD